MKIAISMNIGFQLRSCISDFHSIKGFENKECTFAKCATLYGWQESNLQLCDSDAAERYSHATN